MAVASQLAIGGVAMLMRAAVVTPYTEDAEGHYWPLVCNEYGIAGSDLTGHRGDQILPVPNAYTVLVMCEENTLAALKADSRYVVLWEEEAANEQP